MAEFAHRAQIEPSVLRWAIGRAGLSDGGAAAALNVQSRVLEEWLQGLQQPTFLQAKVIARTLHIPFGYLFLGSPPTERAPIPDFRRIAGTEHAPPSPELLEALFAVVRKQNWWAEHLEATGGGENPLVGAAGDTATVSSVVSGIRTALGIGAQWRGPADPSLFFKKLAGRAEAAGVLVMQRGIVGNNTRRPLSADEFRGFAIADPAAPVVFVNAADSKHAQVFTLVHELAHIWRGQSGISGAIANSGRPRIATEESFCDAVAVEFLVPGGEFRRLWAAKASDSVVAAVRDLSVHFRVSTFVVALRALKFGLIDQAQFDPIASAAIEGWRNRSRATGGQFYPTALARNGRRFTGEVLRATRTNELLQRDGAHLLEVKPQHLAGLAAELEGAR